MELGGTRPPPAELWTVAGLTLLAALTPLPRVGSAGTPVAGLAVAAVVAGFTLFSSRFIFLRFADGGALLAADAPAFELLRTHMTAQDRFYAVAPTTRFGLTYKVASVTGLPSIADYEPQTSRRFAELEVMMRLGRPMASNNDYNLRFTQAPRNRRIFDLLAAHYLLVDPQGEKLPGPLLASLRQVGTAGGVVVYENPQAFPRAFYVAGAVTESEPVRRLEMLATGDLDLHRTVILSAPPPAGAGGESPGAAGDVRIESDRAERVQLAVRADAPGFVVLTDQDYPGWSVTVNGGAAPLLPANHAFRAVPVPAGESTVVWTYRPWSVWIGIGVSLVTLAAIALALLRPATCAVNSRRSRRQLNRPRAVALGSPPVGDQPRGGGFRKRPHRMPVVRAAEQPRRHGMRRRERAHVRSAPASARRQREPVPPRPPPHRRPRHRTLRPLRHSQLPQVQHDRLPPDEHSFDVWQLLPQEDV